MGGRGRIEWTGETWNPVTGCTKVSAGCAHCYAERMARHWQELGQPAYAQGFEVTLRPHLLPQPLGWRRPRRVFVCSMADLFGERVPDDYIQEVFAVMARADWHRFQVLTKRADRLAELAPTLPWPAHIWAGVTVERNDYVRRADCLRRVPAAVRWLSCEPLLGPLTGLDLSGIDWVIAGGESGPGARPMALDWARGLRDRCAAAGVPFWLKQLGGWPDKRDGAQALLDGRCHKSEPPLGVSPQPVLPGME